MTQSVTIRDAVSGAEACIAPQLGFNCYAFRPVIRGQVIEVIDSPEDVLTAPQRPSSFGIPLLFPFPNRIRSGQFTWEGQAYQLPLTPNHPHALHGFCLDQPWRVIDQGDDFVVGRFQLSEDGSDRLTHWPTDFVIDVRYHIEENRLDTQFRIHNPSDRPLPWGLGTHPYFKVPLGADSQPGDCVFAIDVREEWELEASLPTGKRIEVPAKNSLRSGIRFGEQKFDNVYTGWESDGHIVTSRLIDERAGIEITQACDGDFFREAVVFTPPNRNAVCLEPYTCTTDAINLQSSEISTGLQLLDPGATVQTWVAIQASRVIA